MTSRVLVAGSLNMDIIARTVRHPLPGETLLARAIELVPGGKGANQAVAAARAGAPTTIIGKVGSDRFGDALAAFLRANAVDIALLQHTGEAATGTALIVVAETAENTIVIGPGANALLHPADVELATVTAGDVLLSQCEIPIETTRHFFRRGRAAGAITILNPSPATSDARSLWNDADMVVINEVELAFFLDTPVDPTAIASVVSQARGLRAHDQQRIAVTLGADGLVAIDGNDVVRKAGRTVQAVDTTGAGDCFAGALAAELSRGASFERSLAYANVAASLSVQRPGAGPSMPSAAEIAHHLPAP